MPANENKYGLKRSVPAPIKREIRKRVGFGCVVCGEAFATIEHFSPEFSDAHEHSPDGMTLLCGTHQIGTTAGRLTKEQVAHHNRNPYCLKNGHPWAEMNVATGSVPVVQLGNTKINASVFLKIKSRKLIWFTPNDDPNCPFLFNAVFLASDGKVTLEINENIIEANPENWDVQTVGRTIKINSAPQNILLELELLPPNEIKIKRAKWSYGGIDVDIHQDGLVETPYGSLMGGDIRAGFVGLQIGSPPKLGRFYNGVCKHVLLRRN